jgi:esterase/lipase superfamily enzyme
MALKVSFVSCMNAEACPEQPVWDSIAAHRPDVLLLLGDLIYMDWGLASLAKVPGAKKTWEKASAADRQVLLTAFQDEMHDRYAMQWGVPNFRTLVQEQRQRTIVLTWDDHDFAWNNALGMASGKDKWDEKLVPQEFKDIALMERRHFRWVLRNCLDDEYPALEMSAAAPAFEPEEPLFDKQLDGAQLLVLDQRWHRTHRDAKGARLLSDQSRSHLLAAVGQADAGLLILAGSSPLKHRSLSGGHSSWWAEPDFDKTESYNDRAYPEYGEIMLKAKRPVLYLGGEIHRNAWGGWVEMPAKDGTRVPVVQALSSGAALGKLLFHRFRPSYGMVTISPTGAGSDIELTLHNLDPVESDPRLLRITNGQWVPDSIPEGECTDSRLVTDAADRMLTLATDSPLPVFAIRRLGRAFRDEQPIDLLPEDLDSQGLTDSLPTTTGQSAMGEGALNVSPWPTALRAQGIGGRVRLSRVTNAEAADDPTRAQRLVKDTFAIASERGRSVLFFVHGFGKGAAAAMSQALELRERFQCEVLLYTWPTGSGTGLFAALGGFLEAKRAAQLSAPALSGAFGTFCNVAVSNPTVPAVMLARSLGAQAFKETMDRVMPANLSTQALKRLVLSAPACVTDGHEEWLGKMRCPVVVTVNREDRTLRLADALAVGDKLLGRDDVDPKNPDFVYLDCTDVSGVGSARAHDYLFRNTESHLAALNRQLLTGQPIDFEQHKVPEMVAYLKGQRYPAAP